MRTSSPQRLSQDTIDDLTPTSLRRMVTNLQKERDNLQAKFAPMDSTVAGRNLMRRFRRDAGEEDVEENEIDPLTPDTHPAPPNAGGSFTNTQTPTVHVARSAAPPRRLLTEPDKPNPTIWFTSKPPIPILVEALWNSKVYAPLTIFTSQTLRTIGQNKDIKFISIPVGDGSKRAILDVTPYGDERMLSQAAFLEAWPNFLEMMKGLLDGKTSVVYDSLVEYHRHIISHHLFNAHFSAFLEFDINTRTLFTHDPHPIDMSIFLTLPLMMAADTANQLAQQNLILRTPTLASSSSLRYNPYASSQPIASSSHIRIPRNPAPFLASSSSPAVQSQPQSFRDTTTSRPLLCILCGASGHRGANCVANATVYGTPLFAVLVNGELVENRDKSSPVCLHFNLRRCTRSSPNHAKHVCSICGSTEHAAVHERCTRRT
jgi:hypothetical protein